MKPALNLRLNQQLALTPQLQQAIRLLQLSSVELEMELREALESNPLLELPEEQQDAAPAGDAPETPGDANGTTEFEPSRPAEDLLKLVPTEPRRGYDMRKVLEAIVDGGSLFPWKERYGMSVITALARIEGQPVGVVASQPMQRAGVMDVPALNKEAAFADLCDTFNIPLVFFQDVPGLMIGTDAERELDRVEVRSHAEMTAAWQRFRDLYGAA